MKRLLPVLVLVPFLMAPDCAGWGKGADSDAATPPDLRLPGCAAYSSDLNGCWYHWGDAPENATGLYACRADVTGKWRYLVSEHHAQEDTRTLHDAWTICAVKTGYCKAVEVEVLGHPDPLVEPDCGDKIDFAHHACQEQWDACLAN